MQQLVKGIVFAAAALMLMQAPQAQAKVKVKKVTVKSNYGSSVHVAVRKKVKLTTTVKVSPNKSANKKVSYKSSNKKIASVTTAGQVKAVAPGTAKITVTSGSKKAVVTVTVPGIILAKTSVTVKKNKTLTLKPKLYGVSGNVTYTSSNSNVATVAANGKITGVKKGTATITLKAGAYALNCKVKVK